MSDLTCTPGVCAFGRQCVPGRGNLAARIMLIGESPGAYELKYGVPFVGRSGQLLDSLLDTVGLQRGDLYITNTCGCVVLSREDKRPLPAELDACRPRLLGEINMVEPAVVLLLGNTALAHWFPGWRIGQVYNKARAVGGIVYIPTYHPAAALRNPQLVPVITEALGTARRLCV